MFTNVVNLKKHGTNFNFIFNMSSYRKPGIQNDLPKITKPLTKNL